MAILRNYRREAKYGNKKTVYRGIPFDSKAEAAYFDLARKEAKEHSCELRLQETFELVQGFRDEFGKAHQAIKYKADFSFWRGDKLLRVVDVKGMQTKDFRLKAKLFAKRYGKSIILAKPTRSGFVEFAFGHDKEALNKKIESGRWKID